MRDREISQAFTRASWVAGRTEKRHRSRNESDPTLLPSVVTYYVVWMITTPSMPAEERHSTTAALAAEFERSGCCRVTRFLKDDELTCLRAEVDRLRESATDATLAETDCVVEIPPAASLPDDDRARVDAMGYLALRRGQRAASDTAHVDHVVLCALPSLATAVLHGVGDVEGTCYLFNEHYICKPPLEGGNFCWHTDAAHQLEALVALGRRPSTDYVSIWIALDDITAENGALVLRPRDAPPPPGASELAPASAETEAWLEREAEGTLSTVGACAGDAVIFASTLWHCSHANISAATRRAYYAQYSARPLCGTDDVTPLALAVPTTPDATRVGCARVEPLGSLARCGAVPTVAAAEATDGDDASGGGPPGRTKRQRGTK